MVYTPHCHLRLAYCDGLCTYRPCVLDADLQSGMARAGPAPTCFPTPRSTSRCSWTRYVRGGGGGKGGKSGKSVYPPGCKRHRHHHGAYTQHTITALPRHRNMSISHACDLRCVTGGPPWTVELDLETLHGLELTDAARCLNLASRRCCGADEHATPCCGADVDLCTGIGAVRRPARSAAADPCRRQRRPSPRGVPGDRDAGRANERLDPCRRD